MLEKDDLEVLVAVYSLCDGTMIKCTGLYNVCEATLFCADEVANRLMRLILYAKDYTLLYRQKLHGKLSLKK